MQVMTRPKKPNKEYIQVGWRLDGVDREILVKLDAYAKEHRHSRNGAITIAVERMLREFETRKST